MEEKIGFLGLKKRDTWSQSAYQVDDTPRYQSYGKWTHSENFFLMVTVKKLGGHFQEENIQ